MITKEEWNALPYQTKVWCVSVVLGIAETLVHCKDMPYDMDDYYTIRADAEYRLLEFNLQDLNSDY